MLNRKIYERLLCKARNTQLTIPAGRDGMCFAIGFPYEAMITRLIVRQSGGTLVPFVVDLFNLPVCPLGSEVSLSATPYVSDVNEAMAKVLPTQSQPVAGQPVEVISDNGYPFRNGEGTQTVPGKRIFLRIVTQGAEEGSEWDVLLGGLE